MKLDWETSAEDYVGFCIGLTWEVGDLTFSFTFWRWSIQVWLDWTQA